ncbi:hypothetical protein KQX54_010599 [Cotesia glomerata]|uniref:Uncharacterized protein n=1 Tax=Cotesia glomerata TaxID=32391 RepID=A0AAV7ICW5_COTGL|nr:hypothetical protein KQX54_010599 [Cotesia glomerata]
MEVCDVGKLTSTKCHLTDYSNLKTLHNVDQFSNEDRLLLKLRLNNANNISKICDHHKCDYLNYYSVKFRKCCDPFQIHKKNVCGDLRILSLELCLSILTNLLLKLIPGDKICKRCENNLRQKISSQEKNNCSTSQETTDQIDMIQEGTVYDEKELRRSARLRISEMNKTTTQEIIHCSQSTNSTNSICITSSGSEFMTASQDKQDINHILSTLDLPLYEQQALYKTKHQVQAENLVQAVSDKFAEKLSQVADLNITIPDLVNTNLYQDSFALREMIMNLRYFYDNAKTLSEKLEYLSLLPKHWILPKVSQYFSCTNYMWLKLNKFKQMQDPLCDIVYELHQKSKLQMPYKCMNMQFKTARISEFCGCHIAK